MALISLSINIRDSDIILEKLLNYFVCQARGYGASSTCYAEYEELDSYLRPELNSATYFLLGLVPVRERRKKLSPGLSLLRGADSL